MENTSDKLMRAIRFWSTPKCDLTHNSFILRELELFGTELNNVACYMCGTILYLDIQKKK